MDESNRVDTKRGRISELEEISDKYSMQRQRNGKKMEEQLKYSV